MRTYWYISPRNFGNEYEVGVATNKHHAKAYKLMGYCRISRDCAFRHMTWRGDAATQAYVSVTIDGESTLDRFEAVRDILCERHDSAVAVTQQRQRKMLSA